MSCVFRRKICAVTKDYTEVGYFKGKEIGNRRVEINRTVVIRWQ